MNHAKWIEHFTRNRQNRPEPDWAAPINVPPDLLAPVLRSVEQFRLGDGGGPASLIAFNRENFRNRTEEMRRIVDLWFDADLISPSAESKESLEHTQLH